MVNKKSIRDLQMNTSPKILYDQKEFCKRESVNICFGVYDFEFERVLVCFFHLPHFFKTHVLRRLKIFIKYF